VHIAYNVSTWSLLWRASSCSCFEVCMFWPRSHLLSAKGQASTTQHSYTPSLLQWDPCSGTLIKQSLQFCHAHGATISACFEMATRLLIRTFSATAAGLGAGVPLQRHAHLSGSAHCSTQQRADAGRADIGQLPAWSFLGKLVSALQWSCSSC
jgi:hypothetical protein